MKKIISQESIHNTTRCEKNFSCLSNCGPNELCKVLGGPDEVSLRLIRKDLDCSYRMRFGYAYICSCPARIELFNRHRI